MPTESNSPRPDLPAYAGIDEIQSDIEQTRKELGDTVNALAAKADVTGRIKRSVPVGPLIAGVAIAAIGLLVWRRRRR